MKVVQTLAALLTVALLTAFGSTSATAPSNSRILFIHYEPGGTPAPYSVKADGSGLRLAARTPPRAGEFRDGRWSPNGKLLALVYKAGLYLAAADGSSPRRLAAGSIEDFSWSADSTRLVFSRLQQLYLVSVRGSPHLFVKAPENGMVWKPSWSPDGRTIAYVLVPPVSRVHQLWVIRPDGQGKRKLAARTDIWSGPQWSADSSWIAYGAFMKFAFDVYLVRRDGRAARPLTRTDDVVTAALWAPMGTAIAYTIDNRTVDQGVAFHRAITAPRETIDEPVPQFHGPIVWSPDGTQLATHCFSGDEDSLCVATLGQSGFTALISGEDVPLDWIRT